MAFDPKTARPVGAGSSGFDPRSARPVDPDSDDIGAADFARGVGASAARGTATAIEGSTFGVIDTMQRVAQSVADRLADPKPFRVPLGAEQRTLDDGSQAPQRAVEIPNPVGQGIDALKGVMDYEAAERASVAAGAAPAASTLRDSAVYDATAGRAFDAARSGADSLKTPAWKRAEAAFARDLAAAEELPALEQATAVVDILRRHPAVATGVLFESAPSMVASIATGRAVLTAGTKIVGKQAVEAGMSEETARVLAQHWAQGRGRELATAAILGNAVSQSVTSTADEVAAAIMATPDAELMRVSPRYREAREYATEEQVKRVMATDAANAAAGANALTSAMSNLLSAGFESRIAAGRATAAAAKTRAGAVARSASEGVVREAAQEAFESGGERRAQNIGAAASGADPDRDAMEGVPAAATLGGAMGAVMGGGAGVAAGLTETLPEGSRSEPDTVQDNSAGWDQQTPATGRGAKTPTSTAAADRPDTRSTGARDGVTPAPAPGDDGANRQGSQSLMQDEISAAFDRIEGYENDAGETGAGRGSGDPSAEGGDRSSAVSDGETTRGEGAEAAAGGVEPVPALRREAGDSNTALDQAAHEAATSPQNDLREPSEAQKDAGNYRKGHLRLHGLEISVENPAGSRRRPEWNPLEDHYGYIRGTKGRDKEHIDVFVGPDPASTEAFVVDQVDPATGTFDEHKIILGARSEAEAREIYRRNYQSGWRGLGAISRTSVDDLKQWLQKPRRAPFRRGLQPSLADTRLDDDAMRKDLEAMAAGAGWALRGGEAIPGDFRPPSPGARGANLYAEEPTTLADQIRDGGIADRTSWVANEPWFAGVQRDARLPGNEDGSATREAVRKAIAGEGMTAAERRHVAAMLDTIEGELRDAEASNFEPEDFADAAAWGLDTAAEADVLDHALLARIAEADPDGFERAAVQYENDDAQLMAWAQEWADGQRPQQPESRAAPDRRGETDRGTQDEGEGAGQGGQRVEAGRRLGSEEGAQVDAADQTAGEVAPGGDAARPDADAPASNADAGLGRRADPQGPALELEQQTEADLAARSEQQAAAEAAGRDEDRRAADKAQADRERDDFTLTGSDRAADVAMAGGQRDLLGAAQAPAPEMQKPRFTFAVKPHQGGFVIESDDGGGIVMAGKPTGPFALNTTPALVFATEAAAREYMRKVGMTEAADRAPDATFKPGDIVNARPNRTIDEAKVVRSYWRVLSGTPWELVEVELPDGRLLEVSASQLKRGPFKKPVVTVSKAGEGATAIVIDPSADVTPTRRDQDHSATILRIEPWGSSMIVVKGDTKPNKDRIKAVGGAFWNRKAEGWTFKKEREAKVREALADLLGADQNAISAAAGGSLDTVSEEARHGEPEDTAESQPVRAGDGGADRTDGGTGESDRGSLGERVAEADQEAGTRGSVDRSDPGAERSGTARAGSRSTESLDGGDRDPATGGAVGRAPGIVDEPAGDHVITDQDAVGEGGEKKKARQNLDAIELVKRLDTEQRAATADERTILSRYVGWGGIKAIFDPQNPKWSSDHLRLKALLTPDEYAAARASMLDAHYTSLDVVDAMWTGVGHLGFDGGLVLEPSLGTGNFFGRMPAALWRSSTLNGVELDAITGKIASQLYQRASIATPKGFEDVVYPENSVDLVIGNPPFGSQTVFDASLPQIKGFSIHNFFFAKAVEVTRPGGLVAMVVSHNLMDQVDGTARRWIAERAHLLGAVRLPYTAFLSNAGTEVVTDILFLQKARPGEKPDADWTQTYEIELKTRDGEPRTFTQSRYFAANPRMVLGRESATGKMYGRPDQYNVEPDDSGVALRDRIANSVREWPGDVYVRRDKPVDVAATRDAMVPEQTQIYGYYLDGDTVMQRIEDSFDGKPQSIEVAFSDRTSPKRAAGMIGVKEALRDLMRAELTEGTTERTLTALRKALNQTYDDFVRTHGYINSQVNRRAFRDDPALPLLESLEPKYDPGVSKAIAKKREIEPRAPSAEKAAIFRRRVLAPSVEVTAVGSAKDALVASLNRSGRIDPAYMEQIYGKPFSAIADELGNLAFEDPQSGQWEPADVYLSGNVKHKLKLAREAAKANKALGRNVEALETVQPADVPALKIGVRLGSSWVPGSVIEEFARSILGANAKPSIRFARAVGRWSVDIMGADQAASISRWGTTRVPAADVMSAVMNNKQIIVKDNVGTSVHPVWVVNEPETEAARARADDMAAKFKEWIWQDQTRREKLERLYNDGYNTDRRRIYDGSHLTLPGSSPAIALRKHQLDGAWRGIIEPAVLLDHVVGAGKTFEMAAIALELRRLGVSRKPMFAVPKHLVRQWRDELYKLYPNANVLAATEADFERKNRARLFARMATGDWDAIVVSHTSFQKVGAPPAVEQEILDEQVQEIADAIEEIKRDRGDRSVVRDMERIKKNLEAKIKTLKASGGKKDDALDFEQIGVDALFVDEAHLFKNLFYMSQMRGIAGMGSPAGSGRAFDLFVKTQYLQRRFKDRARIVFATGTPVSNSLVEMYTMQRYLAYGELKRRGIHTLDGWAGVYGDVQNVYEVHPSGTGYRLKSRFAKFVNLPSLMELYRSFADVVSLDDLKAQARSQKDASGNPGRFPVPNVADGKPRNIVAERSPLQTQFFGVPEFARDQHGEIVFKYPSDLHVGLDGDGKWSLYGSPKYSVKGEEQWSKHAGPYETEAEAKEQLDVLLDTPVVGYNKHSILWKFENLRDLTKSSEGKINALSVTNEARKAGLDYRLIDPSAPDFEGSKLNLAVTEIKRIYDAWSDDKGTQLVFCDLSTPASARTAAASKEKVAYVRDISGELGRVKATVASIDGSPVAFLVVKEKAASFRVHDGLTGAPLPVQSVSRADAVAKLQTKLDAGSHWLDEIRERYDEIDDDAIAQWQAQQESGEDENTEDDDSISVADLMSMGGPGKFSVYDDVKAKLIAAGIPESDIAFIHDYDTAAKKSELFRDVNAGRVRIVFGSTSKMGAGTNVQERLVALHHLDAPWRPSDLEQREGRIIRQGNLLYERDPDGFEVEIFRYATRQTYDTRMWQLIEHKAAGIEQLRKADASVFEIEDVGGEEANAADMKAAASGNPLILEEIKLRNEVKSLEAQQWQHQESLFGLQRRLSYARAAEGRAAKRVAEIQPFIDIAAANPAEPFAFKTTTGKKLVEKADAAEPLMSAFSKAAKSKKDLVPAGDYRGATLMFEGSSIGVTAALHLDSRELEVGFYGKEDKFSAKGLFTRIDNRLGGLAETIDQIRADAKAEQASIPGLEKEANRPFEKADLLVERRAAHRSVMNQLAKAGGGIELTPKMRRELKRAIAARRGVPVEDEADPGFSAAARTAATRRVVLTASAARAVAEEAYGADGIATLVRKGILQFVNTPAELPPAAQDFVEEFSKRNPGRHAVAVSDHATGRNFIIASRVPASEIPGLLMHEIGEHYGLEDMLGAKTYTRLLAEVRDMHASGAHPLIDEAWRHVEAHYGDLSGDAFVREVIAHLSERPEFRKASLWKRLLSWVRQFLFRIGFTRAWKLRDEDLGHLVAASLRRAMVPGAAATVDSTRRFEQAAAAANAPVFYSQLAEIVAEKLPKKGGAAIYKTMIAAWQRKGEFKKEELEWSGLMEWLDTQGRNLTRDDVVVYLRDNAVHIEEVESPVDRSMGSSHDFSAYQMPGGENYRELLLTLPPRSEPILDPAKSDFDEDQKLFGSNDFRSSHFAQPNILAHVRFNERTTDDGKRVLFVEEVQSDWHQSGRKKGYANGEDAKVNAAIKEYDALMTRMTAFGLRNLSDADRARIEELRPIVRGRGHGTGAVPDAPFKQSWPLLAMKRMLRYASEQGFDSVAWTTGAVQAARYDLSTQVSFIAAVKNDDGTYSLSAESKDGRTLDSTTVPENKLADVVGKDMAERIVKDGGGQYSGVDLQIGGEALRAFYDRELVNEVNRYAKKWDAKVSTGKVSTGMVDRGVADALLGRAERRSPELSTADAHVLEITPAMREAAMAPQPLFAVRAETRAAYAQRIDELFAGSQAQQNGVRVLDSSDVLDLLGYAGKPVHIVEGKVVAGRYNHHLDAADWKKVPDWIENPVAVFDSETETGSGRLVFVAPETKNGKPIHIIVGPDEGRAGLDVHLVINAFDKDRGVPPYRRWIENGLLRYADQKQGPAFDRATGLHISGRLGQAQGRGQKVFSYRDLVKLRNANRFQAAVRGGPPQSRQQAFEDEAWRKAGLPREHRSLAERIEHWGAERFAAAKEQFWDGFQTGMFDRFKPIKDAEGAVDPARSGYISARLSTGANSVLYASLLYGAPQLRGGVIQKKEGSKGLFEILKPVSGDLNRWAAWMVGKRADMLADQHRENNLSLEEIAYLKSLAGDQEAVYEQVAKDVRTFMTDILEVMRAAGLLSADQVEAFSQDAYYLPFFRVDEETVGGDRRFDPASVVKPYTRRGLSHQTSGIKQLKGGTAALNDPIENLFAHITHALDASMKNYAMARTVANIGREITYAREGDRDKAVRVMWGGKPYWVNVADPALLRALTAVGEKPRDGVAMDVGRYMRRLLTTGVTLDPAFMLRNFMRDSMHSWIIDKNAMRFGVDSLRGAAATLKTLRAEAKGNPDEADPAVVSMMFAGASFVGGHVYGTDPKSNAAALRKALRRRGWSASRVDGYMKSLVSTGAQLGSLYVELSEAIENANRAAVYKAAQDAGVDPVKALYEAKDLMDYSLRGQWATIQVLADVLPFFNARLQGLYKLGREARRDPKLLGLVATRIAARGALLALAATAMVARYSGDDRYEELEEWDKDANWHFWINDVHSRIPKPFELGIVFGTIPERMYRLALGYDKFGESVQSLAHALTSTLAINPVPQALRPATEVFFNFDMFRMRPVESMADQAKLAEYRFGPTTSPIMTGIGSVTGMSPKKLEYLWNGYLGTVGTYVLGAADTLVRVARGDVTPTRRIEDYIIAGSFARTGPAWSTEYQTELYEMLREAEQTWRTIRELNREGEIERADRLEDEKRELLETRRMLRKTADRLSTLRKQRNVVLRSNELSADQKRAELDAIQTEINTAARDTVMAAGGQ